MFTSTLSITCPPRRARRGLGCCRQPLRQRAPRPRRRVSTPTIRSRASPNRGTPRTRRRTNSRRCTSWSTTCSSTPARAERPAREEHQHHRRSARLELVHQSHRHPADDDRRDRPRPEYRRAARSVEVGLHSREDVRRASGLHRDGCEGRDLVPRVRSAWAPGRRHRRRRRSRPRSSGRSATTRWSRS